jgi:hypothetical protein
LACKDCGSSVVHHPVVGVCRLCNKKRSYKRNRDANLSYKRKMYVKNRDVINEKRRQGRPPRPKTKSNTRITPKGRYNELIWKSKINNKYTDLGFQVFCELISQNCHYCSGLLSPGGIGLDKKDPSGWYMLDNVVPCCVSCNRVKNNILSYSEMVEAMKAVMKLRSNR